ncbi:hypothetical protein [Lentilactobacillus sunkii]|nr:hypothetical protein [Lentilactobacillus sunkii]
MKWITAFPKLLRGRLEQVRFLLTTLLVGNILQFTDAYFLFLTLI